MQPVFPWMGGKRRLAPHIFPHFPKHSCYVEVFGGAGALLLMNEKPAKTEVYNDIDGDLVTFFRVVQRHPEAFINSFSQALASRSEFDRLVATPAEVLTDIERAARFYYLQKLCFGGRSANRSFGIATSGIPRFRFEVVEHDMRILHTRLQRVVIEALDWRDCLTRYDRPYTLFYLDPPYFETANYGTAWCRRDFKELASAMASLSGQAVLSINDHPDMREVFADFETVDLTTTYTVGGSSTKARELLVKTCG